MAGKIKIEVRLFANLREMFPEESRGVKEFEIPEGFSIDELMDLIGEIDRSTVIIMQNGRREKDFKKKLKPDDRIALFPPVGGG
ncbi:MoaD/ThiS family protein [uncultured Ilyobacter sp.]|uniref:MoaD/ThiS family protein n=1 Tax=uncultured Ilyobacter sp. TaxID=544433 RepID=UPI0029F4C9DC|nr:MoaD/ThiS family protein [uncultured Ilyobacter sp.]